MPNWDDPRGPRRDDERERWRRDRWEREAMRGRREWQGGERRSFEEGPGRFGRSADEGGQEPWRRDRHAPRYGQERDTARGQPYGYAGQEYGLEGHPGVGGEPRAGQGQPSYGRQAQAHPDLEFDPEYLQWRAEQMRAHDRDYQDWRREQHRQYDEQYRQYRGERQRHFGEAFHHWRSQRGMVGGIPDTAIGTVGQGQGGYGDKTGIPGGYNAASAYDRPTGYLDPPGHLSADPAMQQVGGSAGGHSASANPTGDRSPEFGKEPPQVQSAAGGVVHGHERQRQDEKREEAAKPDEPKPH